MIEAAAEKFLSSIDQSERLSQKLTRPFSDMESGLAGYVEHQYEIERGSYTIVKMSYVMVTRTFFLILSISVLLAP